MFIRLNLKDYGLVDVRVIFRKLFAYMYFYDFFLWFGELTHEVCPNIYVHPVGCVLIRVECPVHTEQLT